MSSAPIPCAAPAVGDLRSRDGRELPRWTPREVHAGLVACGEQLPDFESWWGMSPTGELAHVGFGHFRLLELRGYELEVFLDGRWVPYRGRAFCG